MVVLMDRPPGSIRVDPGPADLVKDHLIQRADAVRTKLAELGIDQQGGAVAWARRYARRKRAAQPSPGAVSSHS